MTCELCHREPNHLVILPLKGADGNLNTIACLHCAEQSPAYCQKHRIPHLGFLDQSTACIKCIDELVESKKAEATAILELLKKNLPKKELQNLLTWADHPLVGPRETCVLRFLATKALRSGKTIDDVLRQVIEEKSVESIVPHYFIG
jgi:hypothetical protein